MSLSPRFGVPENMRAGVRRSWYERNANPHLLGRLDLAYDPATRATKLIEYNADTPTTAIETAVIQWKWLEATHPGADQFNSLHERIPERLPSCATRAAYARAALPWRRIRTVSRISATASTTRNSQLRRGSELTS